MGVVICIFIIIIEILSKLKFLILLLVLLLLILFVFNYHFYYYYNHIKYWVFLFNYYYYYHLLLLRGLLPSCPLLGTAKNTPHILQFFKFIHGFQLIISLTKKGIIVSSLYRKMSTLVHGQK